MPFDPDAYLAKTEPGGFDPDEYLAKNERVADQRVAGGLEQSFQEMQPRQAPIKGLLGGTQIGSYVPVVGPLAEKGAAAIAAGLQSPYLRSGGMEEEGPDFGERYRRNLAGIERTKAEEEAASPQASAAKGIIAQAVVPSPGGRGLVGAAKQMAYNPTVTAADVLARGGTGEEALEEAKGTAKTTGYIEAAKALAGGLGGLYSRFFAGVKPETLAKYRANREAINAADEGVAHEQLSSGVEGIRGRAEALKEGTESQIRGLERQGMAEAGEREVAARTKAAQQRMTGEREADVLQRGVAEDLSTAQKGARKAVNEAAYDAMKVAEESGANIKLAPFKENLEERMRNFKIGATQEGPGYDALQRLRDRLERVGVDELPAKEFRRLIKTLDDEISDISAATARAGHITPGERELSGARREFSETMKAEVPGYREAQAKTAGKTEALKKLQEQFSYDPDAVYRELKGLHEPGRMGRKAALENFEQEFGGDFAGPMDRARALRELDYEAAAKPELERARQMREEEIRPYFGNQLEEAERLKNVPAGITRENAQQVLRRYGGHPEKNIATGQRLQAIASEMGLSPDEFTRMADYLATKRAMEGTFTHGSRNVQQGKSVAGAMAAIAGATHEGGQIAKGIGALFGGAADLIGPKVVKKAVDFIDSPAGQRYAKIFEEASKRGPQAVAVTHRMLMQKDPEYSRAVSEEGR